MKASHVEHFQRTLQGRIFRYLLDNDTKKYIDVLEDFVAHYNNSRHSGTGFIPSQITLENGAKIAVFLYPLTLYLPAFPEVFQTFTKFA